MNDKVIKIGAVALFFINSTFLVFLFMYGHEYFDFLSPTLMLFAFLGEYLGLYVLYHVFKRY